jgi:hypothetical protein
VEILWDFLWGAKFGGRSERLEAIFLLRILVADQSDWKQKKKIEDFGGSDTNCHTPWPPVKIGA